MVLNVEWKLEQSDEVLEWPYKQGSEDKGP